jgi:hypothetical protein
VGGALRHAKVTTLGGTFWCGHFLCVIGQDADSAIQTSSALRSDWTQRARMGRRLRRCFARR